MKGLLLGILAFASFASSGLDIRCVTVKKDQLSLNYRYDVMVFDEGQNYKGSMGAGSEACLDYLEVKKSQINKDKLKIVLKGQDNCWSVNNSSVILKLKVIKDQFNNKSIATGFLKVKELSWLPKLKYKVECEIEGV
ncbi:MAG: hypothetical protein N4A33_11680 [Bacteriovoracaceae bacterium]|jgi:hypothetical protein|nr:hypothetical protein [Bacteriovoracaceae bacterium]